MAFILIVAAQFLPREIVWQRLLQLWFQVDDRLADLDAVERAQRRSQSLTTRQRLENSLVRRLLTAYGNGSTR